jgi:hypothetical protein
LIIIDLAVVFGGDELSVAVKVILWDPISAVVGLQENCRVDWSKEAPRGRPATVTTIVWPKFRFVEFATKTTLDPGVAVTEPGMVKSDRGD